jgi:hypothetical protein
MNKFPREHRSCASLGSSFLSAFSSTAPTRPTTPFARQSARTSIKILFPSAGVKPQQCIAATSDPADAPAHGVSSLLMTFRATSSSHTPTWYGKKKPAALKPTPSVAVDVDDDAATRRDADARASERLPLREDADDARDVAVNCVAARDDMVRRVDEWRPSHLYPRREGERARVKECLVLMARLIC